MLSMQVTCYPCKSHVTLAGCQRTAEQACSKRDSLGSPFQTNQETNWIDNWWLSSQACKAFIFNQCFFSHLGFDRFGLGSDEGMWGIWCLMQLHKGENWNWCWELQAKHILVKSCSSASSLTLFFPLKFSCTAFKYSSFSGSKSSDLWDKVLAMDQTFKLF